MCSVQKLFVACGNTYHLIAFVVNHYVFPYSGDSVVLGKFEIEQRVFCVLLIDVYLHVVIWFWRIVPH